MLLSAILPSTFRSRVFCDSAFDAPEYSAPEYRWIRAFLLLAQFLTGCLLQKAVNQGRRCTWQKLSVMKANCAIELTLDECVVLLNHPRRLKRSVARAAAASLGISNTSHGVNSIPRLSPYSSGHWEIFSWHLRGNDDLQHFTFVDLR